MPDKIDIVQKGQPLSAEHYNRLVRESRRQQNVSGAGGVNVKNTGCGVQIGTRQPTRAVNRAFQVAYDGNQNQGYVIALPLAWGGGFAADGSQATFAAYDFAGAIAANSPTAGWTPNGGGAGGNFPNYGTTGPRLKTNWAKRGFLGDARYEPRSEAWFVEWIEHIARYINFSYGGTNQTYSFGQVDTNLTVTNYWDGLDPTKTTFGASNKTNQIALVNSPDGGYSVTSPSMTDQTKQGASIGTAVWRDDLDNSQFWQYQVIDTTCPPDES